MKLIEQRGESPLAAQAGGLCSVARYCNGMP